MKTTSKSPTLVLAALATAFVLGGTTSLWADSRDNNQWDSRHHYRRDNYGYYDGDHYHKYQTWHNHQGYWDTRGATRIFINVN